MCKASMRNYNIWNFHFIKDFRHFAKFQVREYVMNNNNIRIVKGSGNFSMLNSECSPLLIIVTLESIIIEVLKIIKSYIGIFRLIFHMLWYYNIYSACSICSPIRDIEYIQLIHLNFYLCDYISLSNVILILIAF